MKRISKEIQLIYYLMLLSKKSIKKSEMDKIANCIMWMNNHNINSIILKIVVHLFDTVKYKK